MSEALALESLGNYAILIALSTVRIATAFLILPLFTRDMIPAVVRNSLFFALAIISVTVQPLESTLDFSTMVWVQLFVKEVFIGLAVGVFFGLFLWAFEAAGVVIDTQIGLAFALAFDPIIGNEATLMGSLLSRWAVFLFVSAGGLLLAVNALLESFAVWPLLEPIGGLREASVRLFEAELSRFMNLALRIAGPIMIVLFLIDLVMGMINRSAQHFNVFFLSLSIKSMAAIAVLIVLLPFLAEQLLTEITQQAGQIDNYLNRFLLQP